MPPDDIEIEEAVIAFLVVFLVPARAWCWRSSAWRSCWRWRTGDVEP